MKRYIFGLLAVVILVMASFIFKLNRQSVYFHFPVEIAREARTEGIDLYINLYFFFSKKNCQSCLEVIQFLNDLPGQFKITGIVPDNELGDIGGIKENRDSPS